METEVKRGRPARAPEAMTAAPEGERFIEVQIVKKYVPHYCYEVEDGRAELVVNMEGKPVPQKMVKIETIQDKFGRPMDVFRQILEPIRPGVIVKLPEGEAKRALKVGAAQISAGSFD